MKPQLEHLIDASLAQLNNGMDLEAVLALHPDEADELRPILAAAAWVKLDIPGPSRRLEGKQALLDAVVQRRREVELTQGFINEIKAGVPMAELLRQAAPAMRPLLVAAWRMHSTEVPGPDPERFAEGKRLIMAMAERRRAARRLSLAIRLPRGVSGLVSGLGWRTRVAQRAWSGAVAAVAVALVGATGVTTAAADSLPGDTFYSVKRLGENAQLWFAFDPAQRAALDSRFTANRQVEIERLIAEGRSLSPAILGAWLGGRSDALRDIRGLPATAQARLGEALRAWQADGVASIESLVADVAAAAALRAWLDQVAPEPTSDEAAAPSATEGHAVLTVPMPVERPLPLDDRARAANAADAAPKPAAAPVAPPSAAPSGPVVSGPAELPEDVFVQSGSAHAPNDDPDEKHGDGGAAAGAPAVPAQATATEEIPDIIQVPMGPTPVPTSGSGGAADPGSPSQSPATPEPPTEPAPGEP